MAKKLDLLGLDKHWLFWQKPLQSGGLLLGRPVGLDMAQMTITMTMMMGIIPAMTLTMKMKCVMMTTLLGWLDGWLVDVCVVLRAYVCCVSSACCLSNSHATRRGNTLLATCHVAGGLPHKSRT